MDYASHFRKAFEHNHGETPATVTGEGSLSWK
jgi:hypothetical protein